jgi:hypothetical protein
MNYLMCVTSIGYELSHRARFTGHGYANKFIDSLDSPYFSLLASLQLCVLSHAPLVCIYIVRLPSPNCTILLPLTKLSATTTAVGLRCGLES